jgi:hypothetical protein
VALIAVRRADVPYRKQAINQSTIVAIAQVSLYLVSRYEPPLSGFVVAVPTRALHVMVRHFRKLIVMCYCSWNEQVENN